MDRNNNRKTFREIVEETRVPAARRSWRKAAAVGNLRHLALDQGHFRAARLCAEAKDQGIRRAVELAGERICIVEATDDCRFYSCRFPGERVGALHIPKDRLVN